MSEIRVLVVPTDPDEQVRVDRVVPDHATFCGLVEDYNTDTVFFADGDGLVKVAANGRTIHPGNPRATQIMERFLPGYAKRDRVHGTAVFVGLNREEDLCDVPNSVIEFAANVFGLDLLV